ncbi:MAG: amidohydrolase [Candidatus Brocadiae bacterium]|nr:amidohydrolase [Candidatus Brocadiia bacterium]
MKAIDIHVHHRWTKLDQRPDYALERTRSLARQSGVDKVLLLTSGTRATPEELRERNDCTLRLMESDPDFFLPAMYLCPEHGAEFIKDEAARCVEAGMVAIKQSSGETASDARLDPIARAAAEHDIPIVYHAWYKTVEIFEHESTAADIADLARRHPDTHIIMAHLTGVNRRGVQDVEDLPNVSVDTSGGWYDSEMVEYAVRHMGADRVVYGSDYPGRDYAPQVGRVLGTNLSDEDKEKILWRNAAAALKLDKGSG